MKPLRYSQQQIEEEDIAAVVRVMRSPYLTQGPEIEAFEAELAAYVGAKYAICVGSGTAALHLSLESLEACTAVTSPLSFVATSNAFLHSRSAASEGPAFLDVDHSTGLLDIHGQIFPFTDVIIPVHYAGRACPLPALTRTAIIEDACHALGAMDFDGCSKVGSCAHSLATCFSFHPVKPITTGEGGAITTNDASLAIRLQELRSHGRDSDGRMIALGYNYRMTEMQAALGRSQLTRCDEMRAIRIERMWEYTSRFMDMFQHELSWNTDQSLHLLPIRIRSESAENKRDKVKAILNRPEYAIGAQVHYPPIHLQPYYRERFGYKEGDFPEAEAWGREELSLPLHSGMVEADVERVCKALKEALS